MDRMKKGFRWMKFFARLNGKRWERERGGIIIIRRAWLRQSVITAVASKRVALQLTMKIESFTLEVKALHCAASLSYLWTRAFIAASDPNHKLCHCRYEKCSASYFMELALWPQVQQRASTIAVVFCVCLRPKWNRSDTKQTSAPWNLWNHKFSPRITMFHPEVVTFALWRATHSASNISTAPQIVIMPFSSWARWLSTSLSSARHSVTSYSLGRGLLLHKLWRACIKHRGACRFSLRCYGPKYWNFGFVRKIKLQQRESNKSPSTRQTEALLKMSRLCWRTCPDARVFSFNLKRAHMHQLSLAGFMFARGLPSDGAQQLMSKCFRLTQFPKFNDYEKWLWRQADKLCFEHESIFWIWLEVHWNMLSLFPFVKIAKFPFI